MAKLFYMIPGAGGAGGSDVFILDALNVVVEEQEQFSVVVEELEEISVVVLEEEP